MADTIITVHGEHELHHPAERGTVHLSAGFDGAERSAVLNALTQLHVELCAEIEAMVSEDHAPITRWATGQLRVWGERPWNQDGATLPIVYHGAVDLDARFSDLPRLGVWLGEAALRDGVTVRGVDWSLTDDTRRTLTEVARRRAVEAAAAKATVLAASVGLNTVRPLALADPGMLGEGGHDSGSGSGPMLMNARMATGAAPASLDFKPEEITIAVGVDARFAAS